MAPITAGSVPATSVSDPRAARFIVIEGIDGSGSTTQGDRLTAFLQSKGQRVFFTNEPSNGPVGMLIRLALAKRLVGPNFDLHDERVADIPPSTTLDPVTLALLFAADRADHLATQVKPNLAQGRHVICDRYLLSTFAYQGLTVDLDWLIEINAHALRPDLTVYLDVPVEQARQRMRQTRWAKDLYEGADELERIRSHYLHLVATGSSFLGPIITIDASRPKAEVTRRLIAVVSQFIETGRSDDLQGQLPLF